MRLLAAVILSCSLWACSSSDRPCSPTAGDDLKACTVHADAGSPDCNAGESCAALAGSTKCMAACQSNGDCKGDSTCLPVAIGLCQRPDAGGEDGGTPACVTRFVCYPNRCP